VCQLGKLLGRPWRKLDTAKLHPRCGIPENAGEEPLYFVLAIRIFVAAFYAEPGRVHFAGEYGLPLDRLQRGT